MATRSEAWGKLTTNRAFDSGTNDLRPMQEGHLHGIRVTISVVSLQLDYGCLSIGGMGFGFASTDLVLACDRNKSIRWAF